MSYSSLALVKFVVGVTFSMHLVRGRPGPLMLCRWQVSTHPSRTEFSCSQLTAILPKSAALEANGRLGPGHSGQLKCRWLHPCFD
jgi:hypothetical protein